MSTKKLWQPNKSVVAKEEVVGRRIFGDKIWLDSVGQGLPRQLRIDHFFDDQLEHDLSVDRLGPNGRASAPVLRFLTPIATQHGIRHYPDGSVQRLKFAGWGALRVSTLQRKQSLALQVKPSPIAEHPEAGVSANPYHADIVRDDFRSPKAAYALAFQLRDAVMNDFGLVEVPDVGVAQELPSGGWRARLSRAAATMRAILQRRGPTA